MMKADAVFKNAGITSRGLIDFPDGDSVSFLEEDFFHQVLALEKKRSERSGNPALLLKFDFRNFPSGSARNAFSETLNSLLPSIIRETDVIGWYKSGSILGVIFTELGDSELTEAKEKILEKIQETLRDSLGSLESKLVRITFEFLAPKTSWSRNGNGHLHLQPIPAQPTDRSSARRFEIGNLPLKTTGFLMFADLLFISLAHLIGIFAILGRLLGFLNDYGVTCAVSILQYPFTLYVLDLYNMEKISNPRRTAFRIALACVPVVILSTILYYIDPRLQYSRSIFALQVFLVMVFLIAWRTAYSHLSRTAKNKLPAIIVGSGETGQNAKRLINSQSSPFEFKGFVDDDKSRHFNENGEPGILGPTKMLAELTANLGIKAIVLAVPRSRSLRITRKILESRMRGVEVIDMPTLYERLAQRVPVKYIEDQWLLFANGFYLLSKEYVQKMKRISDFVFSTMLLFLFSPVMALTALAIRIDSPGPIFYKQQRVGKQCKVFTVYKFRSMCYNAEEHGAKYAQKSDPRVTRVGKWIRLFRIDELPQIWNVFTGDMSLVGPRPERPVFVEEFDSQIPYYTVRHTVSPGITGWAQIKCPYGASVDDAVRKLEYDLYYIKNMSLLLDVKILLRTVGVVFLGEGAR